MLNLILALPPTDPDPAPGGGGGMGSMLFFLLPLLLLFVLMPLFNKKDRHRRQRIASIKKHDRVVTTGGIFGTVTNLDEGVVTIEIARDVRIRVRRSSVFDLETPADAKEPGREAPQMRAGT
jgi:preprotein translocase subunit YajC